MYPIIYIPINLILLDQKINIFIKIEVSQEKKRETKKKDTDTLTSVGAVGYIKSIIFRDVIFMGFGVVFAFI